MHTYNTALFDLDGTLLDTLDDLADALSFALTAHGLTPRGREEVRMFVGDGVAKLIERAAPGAPPEVAAAVTADFKARYAEHMADKTAPYPGIPELLSALRSRGVRCAVVSNKYHTASRAVCRKLLPGYPSVVIGEGEGIPKKPDPAGCFRAMEALGASPEETLYIGDSDVDAQTARNAGLACALVSWGFRPRASLEKTGAPVVDRPEELLAYFAKGETP